MSVENPEDRGSLYRSLMLIYIIGVASIVLGASLELANIEPYYAIAIISVGAAIVSAASVGMILLRLQATRGLSGDELALLREALERRLSNIDSRVEGLTVRLGEVESQVTRVRAVESRLEGMERSIADLRGLVSGARIQEAATSLEAATRTLEGIAGRLEVSANKLRSAAAELADVVSGLEAAASRLEAASESVEELVRRAAGAAERAGRILESTVKALPDVLVYAATAGVVEAEAPAVKRAVEAILSKGLPTPQECREAGEAILEQARASSTRGPAGVASAALAVAALEAMEKMGCDTGVLEEARRVLSSACERACGRTAFTPGDAVAALLEKARSLASSTGREPPR